MCADVTDGGKRCHDVESDRKSLNATEPEAPFPFIAPINSGGMSRATIRDVAREAGVGIGTVSRVLSGSPFVAEPTRARVRAVAQRLAYHPSPAARALPRGRSRVLEVVVPLFTRFFYIEVLRGIEEALASRDYALVIRSVEQPAERNRVFREPRRPTQVDGGMLVSLTPTRTLLGQFRTAALPLVLIDAEHAAVSSVSVDHEAAAILAVRHLIGLGHERIALVGRAEDPFASDAPDARQRGYRAALLEGGIRLRPEYERATEFSPEAGAAAMDRLLALKRPPTAVFCGSDIQALGVLETARRRGRRVPEDVAVVGYNDVELAEYLGLSTVRIPMRTMGRVGAELLLRGIEDPKRQAEHIRLPVELVVRRTSGAALRQTR
jgi:DNA-binding LacI/PurR family transcriptional regulator